MAERKFIVNKNGELVNVSKEEYLETIKENPELQNSKNIPTFQTPEQQEERKEIIEGIIEELKAENLTNDDMRKIENEVQIHSKEDIEKENRERLDDDIKSFKMPKQQEAIEEKDDRIENIINKLNQLNIKEEEMERIAEEIQEYEKENTEEKPKEIKEDGRE